MDSIKERALLAKQALAGHNNDTPIKRPELDRRDEVKNEAPKASPETVAKMPPGQLSSIISQKVGGGEKKEIAK